MKLLIGFVAGLLGLAGSALAGGVDPANWPAVLSSAKGQTVYWHAWGGEPRINSYIARVGAAFKNQYAVTLVQVKSSDTANVVAQVLAEKAAGKTSGGSVDLVWINGENFAAMKRQGLLASPAWAELLMSPQMQALKQDRQIWGDPTVLDVAKLAGPDKARFDAIKLGIATLRPAQLGKVLPEPHPSWVARIEAAWAIRYGA
ncbi:MAG: hypothetical protein ACTSUY_05215 [Alphaproteobacteria bacterium]